MEMISIIVICVFLVWSYQKGKNRAKVIRELMFFRTLVESQDESIITTWIFDSDSSTVKINVDITDYPCTTHTAIYNFKIQNGDIFLACVESYTKNDIGEIIYQIQDSQIVKQKEPVDDSDDLSNIIEWHLVKNKKYRDWIMHNINITPVLHQITLKNL